MQSVHDNVCGHCMNCPCAVLMTVCTHWMATLWPIVCVVTDYIIKTYIPHFHLWYRHVPFCWWLVLPVPQGVPQGVPQHWGDHAWQHSVEVFSAGIVLINALHTIKGEQQWAPNAWRNISHYTPIATWLLYTTLYMHAPLSWRMIVQWQYVWHWLTLKQPQKNIFLNHTSNLSLLLTSASCSIRYFTTSWWPLEATSWWSLEAA